MKNSAMKKTLRAYFYQQSSIRNYPEGRWVRNVLDCGMAGEGQYEVRRFWISNLKVYAVAWNSVPRGGIYPDLLENNMRIEAKSVLMKRRR